MFPGGLSNGSSDSSEVALKVHNVVLWISAARTGGNLCSGYSGLFDRMVSKILS